MNGKQDVLDAVCDLPAIMNAVCGMTPALEAVYAAPGTMDTVCGMTNAKDAVWYTGRYGRTITLLDVVDA